MRALFLVVVLAACTERNPAYCGDGTCIDPARPYCDFDGSIAGSPGTCIAVSCNAGELAICRGDAAITCSASGTNYDTVQCQFGCDPAAAGCKQCTSNAQCEASEVCDSVTSHCRGCNADDECDSRVCDLDAKTCVAESSIVYAAPGALSGTCARSQPCWVMTAIGTAQGLSPTPIVRMLPGNYTMPLKFSIPTAQPLRIVATGANMNVIGDTAAIVVDSGASLDIRGLTSTSERQVQCGLASNSGPFSSARVRNSSLTMIGSGAAFELQRCELSVYDVELETMVNIVARDDSTFKADRFHMHGPATNRPSIVLIGARITIDVINAVFDRTHVVTFLNDTGPPGTSIRFAFSTFLLSEPLTLCDGTASYLGARYENSILAVQGGFDAFTSPSTSQCTFVSTILTRQSGPPSGTTVADPQFVDLAGGDLHLEPTSPAVDAATLGTVGSDHDIDGRARPSGAAPDLGAYEHDP